MKMREQAEDRLRECEEKRKNLESERNAHQDNFPDDGRPFNERLEEHQKKLEELNNEVEKAKQEEHEAQMELDRAKAMEQKARQESIENRKEMNQGREDDHTEQQRWE